jgi:hypothetical protein
MSKLDLLKTISFGARVAEEETAELAKYFVETDQWARVIKGEIDIVRGDKGAGKSAIYSLLMNRESEFFDRSILFVPGEKPRGAPVFKDIIATPPTAESEFIGLWKIYILALEGRKLREWDVNCADARKVYSALEDARLLDREMDLAGLLRAAQDLARRIFNAESVEGGISIDPSTGTPGFSGKITLQEPTTALRDQGFLTADRLLAYANAALESTGLKIWLLLDRLDVAFAETHELERNALRALFRVYRDISEHGAISLKIFLRSDIWSRISEGGFREASHITKFVVLEWSEASLLNLVIRRLISNEGFVSEWKLNREDIFGNVDAQRDLFYRVFPDQVDQGSRKPSTLEWMISRCADAAGKTAPRELIHLLTSLREKEIRRLELGGPQAPGEQLFDRSVFKEALKVVSETRLQQNLIAEYPDLKPFLLKLSGEKTEQTLGSLAALWQLSPDEAAAQANRLVEVGFFQPRGSKDAPTFWVPFLFRDGLSMSQGLAE